jgi:hypothetical protein
MGELESKVDRNSLRLETLEEDVNTLKIDVAKVHLTLEHSDFRAEERFKSLSTSQMEVKDIIKERMKSDSRRGEESRAYRVRREQLELQSNIDRQKWVRSLINPQTIFIIFAIVLSFFGMRIAEVSEIAEIVGIPMPAKIQQDSAPRAPESAAPK